MKLNRFPYLFVLKTEGKNYTSTRNDLGDHKTEAREVNERLIHRFTFVL